ncbi:MAG: endonuclease MutS2 [Clostridia bacterium]|nr:endonuclease MutS2 [Clostridia bacterium]
MNNIYREKLEFNKILDDLQKYCVTFLGKDYAKNLLPIYDKEKVQEMLNETNEAVSVLYKASNPPLEEIADITVYLKILASSGILSLKAILDLARILKISDDLKKYFTQDFVNIEDYPFLKTEHEMLYTNYDIYSKIFKIVIDENTVSDDASSKLKEIRRNQRKFEQNIKTALNGILQKNSKYVQESIITIRNERYVIPVKEEYRSQVKGLVHDISSTGSTVFIEPLSVFELNNQLNNLKIEEKIEIEKIIKELSALFVPYIENLEITFKTIGVLDFIFAKAKYSKALHAVQPIINDEKFISLKNVKHPLLNQESAVPISLELGKDFTSLIITGPNTGGKTVTLKTAGLICLMACSGLNIPADDGSSIYVFDNIFADIGDDQSISESISTFSSHILNIVDIIKNATANSLILVDELGSGTDPVEGANLAISILEHFKILNALTIATTHYQELKKYALVNDGFENASVEFDIETLSPTYKLLIGIPGRSNAFEISKKLGVSADIIDRAKQLLNSDDVKFETVLKSIYDNKIQIEKEKQEIFEKLEEASKLTEKLAKDNTEKEEKAREIITNAKIEARKILLDAKDDVNELIKQANSASSKELNAIRNTLNDKIKVTSSDEIGTKNVAVATNPIIKSEIVPNLKVFVTTLGQEGVVVSNISKDNEVQVLIGSLKMSINIANLQKVKENKGKNTSNNKGKSNYSYKISKSQNINSEINVIGENVLDATALIDKYLDDCAMAKLPSVRIVHGKGTGKLKQGIHAFLKHNPHVKSYRMGTFGEGEMGVTIVELK